jgi:hypothetical protein
MDIRNDPSVYSGERGTPLKDARHHINKAIFPASSIAFSRWRALAFSSNPSSRANILFEHDLF